MTIPHGTPSGYSYHGCRCDVCKAGNRTRMQKWRVQSGTRVSVRVPIGLLQRLRETAGSNERAEIDRLTGQTR